MYKSIIVLQIALAVCFVQGQNLPKFNVLINQTSVSGISAGGFMAQQLHIAYSNSMIGVGVISGGPYLCDQGVLAWATTFCMYTPLTIDVDGLITEAKAFAKSGLIDSTDNIQNQKAYFYHGKADTVVVEGVVQKAVTFYQKLNAQVQTIFNISSQHGWITNNYGNPCKTLGSPYMLNCNYEAANDIMKYIYGSINQPVQQLSSNLFTFNQSTYGYSLDSLGPIGYYYVPNACQQGQQCKIHIALHGCEQTLADIGQDFVVHTGLNELAEANNFIVLYPQVKRSPTVPYNPKGCFDWWGYTEAIPTEMIWATKKGKQMMAIWHMVSDLSGVPFEEPSRENIIELDQYQQIPLDLYAENEFNIPLVEEEVAL